MQNTPHASARHFHTGVHYLRNLLTATAALGADPNALLAAAGVARADLDDPHMRVRDDQKLAAWERAAAMVADPNLGLRVGETAPLGRWGLAEQLILHSPTFGEGLETSVRFAALLSDGKRLHLDRLGPHAVYTVATESAPPRPVPAGWRHLIESDLAYAVRLIRLAVSPTFTPEEVWFAHGEPAGVDSGAYARLLGPQVRFAQSTNAIHFDAMWLDAPIESAVPALRVPLEVAAARALARIEEEQTTAGRVEAFLRLDPSTVTIGDVAERLGVSTRTLQRRLRAEDTSFQDLLDGVRREYAEVFLRDPALPLSEVSYRLGFSEPSALYRAVRRWLGMTATEYRQAMQSA